jgi:adenine deaminase
MKISGQIVDIHNRTIYPGIISIVDGRIAEIKTAGNAPAVFIIPGLIDSHIHIESSMVTPGAFALTAVSHGTTAVVSDPHEIANVLGEKGVRFMIADGNKVPLKFWFGAPSCVPATSFETSGAVLDSSTVADLLRLTEIKYLSEMMNFPGVIFNDKEVTEKIGAAKRLNKPVDGHAPGLSGADLEKYVKAGITTDHECSTIEEAREKYSLGMKILIREGSAARNLEALKGLITEKPQMVMLCSDDLHPEMLQVRHLNKVIASLISEGFDVFDVLRCVSYNPSEHYKLDSGLLRKGDSADLVIVDSLKTMNVIETWINGEKVFAEGKVLFNYSPGEGINNFNCKPLKAEALRVPGKQGKFRVIEAFEGELLTKAFIADSMTGNVLVSDNEKDILKIVVKDRYKDAPPAIGFIKGFGLKKGAFASSVAHDSHNIIAVGISDVDIVAAINEIVRMKGGLAVADDGEISSLQLNIGGIMTTRSCSDVAADYEKLSNLVMKLGSHMKAPFMTLSFMALLVIPELKLSDKGLFDGKKFEVVPLFV